MRKGFIRPGQSLSGHSMKSDSIVYFDSPGKENTEAVLAIVSERVRRGGVQHVVVASGTGETADKMLSKLEGTGAKVVVVTEHCGASKEGECDMSPEVKQDLESRGAVVVRATHALSGVERSVTKKTGGSSRVEAIAEALRALFGQGMKVCVEIAVMAADNGAIPCGDDAEVITVAGKESGADTACVVRPAHANSFFNLEVREILAIPRRKR